MSDHRPTPEPLSWQTVQTRFPPAKIKPAARRHQREALRQSRHLLLVLDDDPTGTQTVHDVDVLLAWGDALLAEALAGADTCLYLSTNSRSLPTGEAEELARSLGERCARAERASGRAITIASRSDSTLRGHFPLEVDAFVQGYGERVDGVLICPAFFDGGRYTFDDTHWVRRDDILVPAGQTEFAQDPQFGFEASYLPDWVTEKTGGRVPASTVKTVSLGTIRSQGAAGVAKLLLTARDGQYIVINAMEDADLDIVSDALWQAEQQGKRFLLRCAASLVKTYAGLADQPLLDPATLTDSGPGLIVVGSFVQRTTDQLNQLRRTEVAVVELPVDRLLTAANKSELIAEVAQRVDVSLSNGETTVLATSRTRHGGMGEAFLEFGRQTMLGLTNVVANIQTKPTFVMAKGGITSYCVARDGMHVTRARVLGQIAAGVPVWQLGPGAIWEQVPYIVFPGNVGADDTLAVLVKQLARLECAS